MSKKRILLVDDHTILRQAMRGMIDAEADMQVVGEASSGQAALKLIRQQEFDVMVLDISMPDKNGVDTLRDLKNIAPDLPVLILSGYSADSALCRSSTILLWLAISSSVFFRIFFIFC